MLVVVFIGVARATVSKLQIYEINLNQQTFSPKNPWLFRFFSLPLTPRKRNRPYMKRMELRK
jgi:hypothetical protein